MKIYNTLTKKKETLDPIEKGKINIFVCGPTTYNFIHIGNARTFTSFDLIVNYLRHKKFKVNYIQNLTDIDDKIINAAKEAKQAPLEFSEKYCKEFLKDMKDLGNTAVSKYIKATDKMDNIISQVERLLEKEFAYKTEDGIYFNISIDPEYGKLSGRTALQAEDATTRVDSSSEKKNKGDFCLWKFAKEKEISWDAPFGKGRPGWHIEDTAITEEEFGQQYDIHGGAIDLIFPHHEAEIAQMEAISNKKPFVKYWMHAGFLDMKKEKMSKSIGNIITLRDLLKQQSKETIRFFYASAHYRNRIEYSEENLENSKNGLARINNFILNLNNQDDKELEKTKKAFYDALDDDFNTPEAFAKIFEYITYCNKNKKGGKDTLKFFKEINNIFKILNFDQEIPENIIKLAEERLIAKKDKNWEKSDKLRYQIHAKGFQIEDKEDSYLLRPN